MKYFKIFTIFFILSGCSTYVERKKTEDFVPIHEEISFKTEEKNLDGSIYNSASSGFFASDRRASKVGDILTITLKSNIGVSSTASFFFSDNKLIYPSLIA